MIKSGVDIMWVSKTLGHKDISITLKVYTKYIKEADDVRLKNLEKIDRIVKFIDKL
jgi:integrase